MIDIHNHILPGVDDGAQSIEEADALLKDAVADGINALILTPHYMHGGLFRVSDGEILERFEEYKHHVRDIGINVELYLGNEIMIHKDIDKLLEEKRVHTLAGSDYILVEFPMDVYREEYDEYLYNAALSGYKIIIAHPERYHYVKEKHEFARRWTIEGYFLQCNADSLFRKREAKAMHFLIEKGMCSFIASDGHNAKRPVKLSDTYDIIEKQYSKDIAERLFITNPEKIIGNKDIAPMPIKKRRWL